MGRKLSIIRITAYAFLLTILFSVATYADGWSGESGFAVYSGAGSPTTCGAYDSYYRVDCTGWSWIWYRYNGSGTKDPIFYNTGIYWNANHSDHVRISSVCADIGGFWHAGYNGRGSWGRFVTSTAYTDSYSMVDGAWGHWGTLNMAQARGEGTLKSPLGHTVGGYTSNKSGTKSSVWPNYVSFRQYMGYSAVSSWPNNLWGFCYGSAMEEQTATYEGQSSVSGSNGDISSNGGVYSITFTHQLRKTGATPSSYNPGTTWSVAASGQGSNTNDTKWSVNTSTWTTVRNTPDITGTLLPGEEKTICQQLTYQDKVSSVSGKSHSTTATPQCRTISRGISNSITGGVKVQVGGTEYQHDEIVEVPDGNYTISFQHELYRKTDNAHGSVTSSWSTSVSGKDLRNWDVSPRGQNRNGSTSLAENSTAVVVPFNTETFTGTLYPDETKRFCQTLTFESYFDHPAAPTTSTVTKCIRVHRQRATCSDGSLQGVQNGRNRGQISVRKTATNGSTDWQSTGMKDSGNWTVRLWARPTNRVHFKEDMCEGAEQSNQYFDLNKDISYNVSASEARYMSGLSTSTSVTWNNGSIKGSSNVGKDIWNGNSYAKTTYSPSTSDQSTAYTIGVEHLGKSFQQTLTWTDLWINNNHEIDRTHNGGGSATSTAEVYIPYNYKLKPETTSNDNPFVMPGTSTYTITPSITVEDRTNTPANGDTPYSTKTKETRYQVISFTIDEKYRNTFIRSSDVYTNKEYFSGRAITGDTNLSGVCTSFISGGAKNCRQEASGSGIYDPGKTTLNTVSINVAETLPIGAKVCTVIAAWPSDSHNNSGNITSEDDEWNGITASENEGTRMWRISQPTCSTVAKKPNFQVYNNGAYAEDKINTAVSNRTHPGGTPRSYGSWSEFEVVSARNQTLGLASGAMLWGGIGTLTDAMRYCYVSPLTITNNQCGSGSSSRHVGQAGVNKLIASDPENIYNQIMTRYTRPDSEDNGINTNGRVYQLKLEGACDYDEVHGNYVPRARGGNTTTSFSCLANGSYYTKVNGDAKTDAGGERTVLVGYDFWGRPVYRTYINQMWTSTDGEHSSNTYVTHVKGTLYINQNFHYGNIDDLEDTRYTSISEIPQNIFIARDIKIDPTVDHIDAWLIAENSIDTCYPGSGVAVSVNNCNTQLTVTGPVIAKKLYLNRTYGGGMPAAQMPSSTNATWWQREDSQAAERFAVNPFTYLWSYSQSQRYSQAITTYSRELPTRY